MANSIPLEISSYSGNQLIGLDGFPRETYNLTEIKAPLYLRSSNNELSDSKVLDYIQWGHNPGVNLIQAPVRFYARGARILIHVINGWSILNVKNDTIYLRAYYAISEYNWTPCDFLRDEIVNTGLFTEEKIFFHMKIEADNVTRTLELDYFKNPNFSTLWKFELDIPIADGKTHANFHVIAGRSLESMWGRKLYRAKTHVSNPIGNPSENDDFSPGEVFTSIDEGEELEDSSNPLFSFDNSGRGYVQPGPQW